MTLSRPLAEKTRHFALRISILWHFIHVSFRIFEFPAVLGILQCLNWTGGALNFFSGRGVRPGFPKYGACELTFASENGGLWAENFQIWGLVSWKLPNLGACELKISKFGGLWAKIWVKIQAVEAKIAKFSQKGVLWTDCFAWNGALANGRRGVKRGSSGLHTHHTPFLGQCPPGPERHNLNSLLLIFFFGIMRDKGWYFI